MKRAGLLLSLSMVGIALMAGPAAAQASRAFDICAKAALQQAMLVMSVDAETALRDKRGVVVGKKLDLRVNALGKKKVVTCLYTDATRVATIRPYQQDAGSGNAGGTSAEMAMLRRDAVRSCQKASQRQGLMLDTVVSQDDVYDRRGKVTGSEVTLNVLQAGRSAQVICEYDFVAKTTDLELRRATLR